MQHFLLSAASRTISLKGIYQMGEAKAYQTFCEMRWDDGQATCPRCGCLDTYHISTRRKFKCKGCNYQFSVTSGTIFASRKMSFTDLLAAICLIVNGAKGISMIQMSRDLNCQYKTAFVLAHKIREAMGSDRPAMPLEGDVEVDGMYNGGYVRPANLKENRVDRRLAENQTGKRRVVVAFRQRKGRTLPFVVRSEAEGIELAMQHVSRMAVMHADEASHWDRLHEGWQVGRINHSEAYATLESCTNQVESYFNRRPSGHRWHSALGPAARRQAPRHGAKPAEWPGAAGAAGYSQDYRAIKGARHRAQLKLIWNRLLHRHWLAM